MAVCYIRMGRTLWRNTPGEVTDSTVKCERNKRRIVKMFAVVITVFGVCWLPCHAYFLYSYHSPDIMKSPNIKNIYLGFYWLAMANCAVNPIVSNKFTTGWATDSGNISTNCCSSSV